MRRFALLVFFLAAPVVFAQKEYGFDNQKSSGQPYLTPAETVSRMKVAPGFSVKLFAAEPLMTNPIAMTIDGKGRVWIIESFEYPKRTPKGKAPRDRIVILEDTDGDGIADKRTVFAEGKDFPVTKERAEKGLGAFDMASGLEVTSDGCYVGAPPYLWHIKGKDKAESFEIVASGFGSQDTHETLNTFTWGPDGWLYGLHGVFTTSKIKPGEPDTAGAGAPIDLDAGVWRFHPRSKKFEVFAEGTSNPWGMDFNSQGECFICACVIPHLYHIVPGGIYIKQGGKPSYNQYAYGALREICDHTFHKESGWAHAGLLCLDVPHMPKEYQNSVIFGSIHGCSIKRNTLKPNGSTFTASRADDFLVSGDKNFRPIQMRWAPDGSILVSDWHDQNPCHQTKPDDWDYERGRIYRIVPPKPERLIAKETLPFQVRSKAHLDLENLKPKPAREIFFPIEAMYTGDSAKVNLLSLSAFYECMRDFRTTLLIGHPEVAVAALNSQIDSVKIWALRTLTEARMIGFLHQAALKPFLQKEKSLRVLLEVLSAIVRSNSQVKLLPLLDIFYAKSDLVSDPVIPSFLWWATEQEIGKNRDGVLQSLIQHGTGNNLLTKHIIPRVARRIAASGQANDLAAAVHFVSALPDDATQIAGLSGLVEALKGRRQDAPPGWATVAGALRQKKNPELNRLVQQVAASLNDPEAIMASLKTAGDTHKPVNERIEAVRQLALTQPPQALLTCLTIITSASEPLQLRIEAARGIGSIDQARVPGDVIAQWKNYPAPLRAELVNTLRSRKPWAKAMLEALGSKAISRSDLNDNVALAIRQFKDKELNALLEKHYGVFRDSPAEIDALLAKLRREVPAAPGNAVNGKAVFAKHCLQCHKFEGQGHDVGPNLDGAERSMEYLLVNVVDPNRVVGTPYFSRTILLKNGKLITGILAEEDATTIRLKRENAVIEVIVKADIEEQTTSTKSLMPEGLPNNMTLQELRDLIGYLQATPKK